MRIYKNKSTGLLRKLQKYLPRQSLVTTYKSFIRSHLDYGDVMFDQAYNKSFHKSLESLQYNASLAITRAIRGTSKVIPYREPGLESLQHRCWFCKLCTFYKMFKNQPPRYLYELLSLQTTSHNTRSSRNIPLFHFKHNFFKKISFKSSSLSQVQVRFPGFTESNPQFRF